MPKRVLLVGHCGPDGSYLRQAVKAALGEVKFILADDNQELDHALAENPDLILLNRELTYGFEPPTGVEMIRALKLRGVATNMMLVSNHADAQAQALAAGAAPGFGKREIGSPKVTEVLRAAVGDAERKG
jgi:DNA-binding response OmpR family regulator